MELSLSNYAKIGRSPLIQLLGLQPNHKKEIQQLDAEASGCSCCPNSSVNQYINSGCIDSSRCNNCPNAVYKTKTIYVNEKNLYSQSQNHDSEALPYGNQHMFKSGAVRLYIALHFCGLNTVNGTAYDINLRELSELLSCEKKTVCNNLELLAKYEYITYIQLDNEHATVHIRGYKNIFAKASRGGRGYIVIQKELLEQILSFKKINDLRLCLRLLNETTINSEKSGNHLSRVKLSYDDLRRYLPFYVKPYIIRNILPKLSPLFPTIQTGKKEIIAVLSDQYVSSRMQNEMHDNYVQITEYINNVRALLDDFNKDPNADDPRLELYHIKLPGLHLSAESGSLDITYDAYQNFYINNDERNNLARLSVEYSVEEVLSALSIYYNEYVQPRTEIKSSLGGLIRTIIREEHKFYKLA